MKNILLFKVLHLWSQAQESLPPKFMMSKVLLWQRAGYVSKDVWNEMGKIVSKDLLPSRQEINEKSDIDLVLASGSYDQQDEMGHVTDKIQRLGESDVVSDQLFFHIVQSVYPSKRKSFALNALGLEESEYDQIVTKTRQAGCRNYQVFLENILTLNLTAYDLK